MTCISVRDMIKKSLFPLLSVLCMGMAASSQEVMDTIPVKQDTSLQIPPAVVDTPLRITNLNPFFTLSVDSMLSYQLHINKDLTKYYWYLKNSPIGLKIHKDNGLLSFKAEKSFFLSGKLKYDQEYTVSLGVQNLSDPREKVDTSFTIIFYNTEVVPSRLKFSVASTLIADEGQTISFDVLCESGNFPIEHILFSSSISLTNYTLVKKCDERFTWTIPYDFVTEEDDKKQKEVIFTFIGSTRFQVRDTANMRILVRNALNYPFAVQEHKSIDSSIRDYTKRLMYVFYQLDKRVRKTKGTRSGFDVTAGSAALTGTILNTSTSKSAQNTGKVLPSVGVALTPIKEATSPVKTAEQNQASLIRTTIKRLNYMLTENTLIGERDPDIQKKTGKLKDELRQAQAQLVDIALEPSTISEKELDRYFNSEKVNKKYRLK